MSDNVVPTEAFRDSVIGPMPEDTLLAVARNESASHDWRKAATKLLMQRGSRLAKHAELVWFVREIEKEELAEREVVAVVEAATEEEFSSND